MNFITKIKEQATRLTDKISSKGPLVQISDRIFHCPYPSSPNSLRRIKRQLDADRMQVWNLSEYVYPEQLKQHFKQQRIQAFELTYDFYSSMPLTVSIKSIHQIDDFLSRSNKNYVLVHCQQNKSRSVVFLTMLLYLSGRITDIATALAEVNQKFQIAGDSTVFSSQHSILRNVANYHRDPGFINRQQLRLTKVIINEAPALQELSYEDGEAFQVYLQIRTNGRVVYKKAVKQFGQGEIVQFVFKTEKIVLADDCLFSFKYVHKGKVHPVVRVQINTNFIFNNFLRVQKQEIDLTKQAKVNGQIFVDFLFEPMADQVSELGQLSKEQKKQAGQTLLNKIKTNNQQQPKSEVKKSQKQQVFHTDEHAFKIGDDVGSNEAEEDELNEEKINQMLANMAMKKAQVEEQIKEEQEEEQESKVQQIQPAYQQEEKLQQQHRQQIQTLPQQKPQQNVQPQPETQQTIQDDPNITKPHSKSPAPNIPTNTQQPITLELPPTQPVSPPPASQPQFHDLKSADQPRAEDEPEDEVQVDMDDYLSKLEQQADD